MTNLIAQLSISLVLATNWVGVNNSTNELGYVVTNHVATVNYEGKEHRFVLKEEAGHIAAWRPAAQPITAYSNVWWNAPGLILTNLGAIWLTNAL